MKSIQNPYGIVVIVILLVLGITLTVYSLRSEDQSLRTGLLIKTRLAGQSIDPGTVSHLSGSPADLDTPGLREVRDRMMRIQASDPEIRFVYLIGKQPDGSYFFYGDSEPADSPDLSPPGQVYTEAPDSLDAVFAAGTEEAVGPYTDRWGTWVSGFVPLYDQKTGDVIAVFGMDVDARRWDSRVILASLPAALVTLILLILSFFFLFMQEQAGRENRALIISEKAARESEERYRLLFTQSPVGIIHLDRAGIITTSNQQFADTIGVSPDDMVGFNMLTRVKNPAFVAVLSNALAGKSGSFEGPYTSVLSGRQVFIRMIVRPIGTREGKITGLIAIIEDITDKKQAEDALFQTNRKLNLLSSITRHDILNQLVALKGFLVLSMQPERDPDQRVEYARRGLQAAATIERVINFTRDYQDMGVKAPVWQGIRECIGQAAAALPMKEIRVDIDCPDLDVYADPLFEKVFYNLIDNALRYGGESLTTIRVSAEPEDDRLILVCGNDGAGIPANEKDRIFEKGYGKNTGFGLFLTREILSITGISIRETGEPEHGARFELIIPPGKFRFTRRKSD